MKGQWLGSYTGSTDGKMMVNIDEIDDHFEAVAYLKPTSNDIPASVAYFLMPNKRKKQTAVAHVFPVNPHTGFQGRWEDIKGLYGSEAVHSTKANVNLLAKKNKLYIKATTDLDFTVEAELNNTSGSSESKIKGQNMSWKEFKLHISSKAKSKYIFRGQKKPWRLCTSFHRRGRYRISEFVAKDVKQLHQRLSAITSHYFDLTVPDQNGAFFNLLQHHGYPTPLLDWSHSPYVAAFFAFRDLQIGYEGNAFIRIYIFNSHEWVKLYPQIQYLDPAFPHLSIAEFIAIDNPRLVPQQAVTTATNLDDIEAYILEKEAEAGVQLLEAINIPANERENAMMDLHFMGITAGSMFPGIDGVCEELREKNFNQ